MPFVRILGAALVLFSLPAFTQDNGGFLPSNRDFSNVPHFALTATPSEPWRIIPKQPLNTNSARPPLDRILSSKDKDDLTHEAPVRLQASIPLDQNSQMLMVKVLPDEQIPTANLEDKTCYAIHSYVVARDDKDSDSTHAVSSSTCQPARHYGLRNADM
jgi:hypothetical protein